MELRSSAPTRPTLRTNPHIFLLATTCALIGACALTTNLRGLEGGEPEQDEHAEPGGGDTGGSNGGAGAGTASQGGGGAATTGDPIDDGGAGGASATTTSVGSTSAATTGSGGAASCASEPDCDACVLCAQNGRCLPQVDACWYDYDCNGLVGCLNGCAADNVVCSDGCFYYWGTSYAVSLYDTMWDCLLCAECLSCPDDGFCS